MKRAILFGASGHVGGHLLQELLHDVRYEKVIIVVRRLLDIEHPKLTMLQGDYLTLALIKDQLIADDVFITLGGASSEAVEREYPVLIARLTQENGARSVSVITAVGANPSSAMKFTRIKGEIENDIAGLGFAQTHFFRVSMIMGRQSHFRPMERTMMAVWRIISPFLFGRLKKYKGLSGKQIATAMYRAAQEETTGVGIYHWAEMVSLLNAKQLS